MDYENFRTKEGKRISNSVKKKVNAIIDEFMELDEQSQVLFSWFIMVDFLGVGSLPEEPTEVSKEAKDGGGMYG